MARSALARSFVLGVAVALSVIPGCSKQGEGERCEPLAGGDDDCDSGLVCVPNDQLLDKVENACADFGRCCPPDGGGDERCARGGLGTAGSSACGPVTGQGGEGGEGGTTDVGGAPASGAGGEAFAGESGAAGAAGAGATTGAGGQSGAAATAGAGGI